MLIEFFAFLQTFFYNVVRRNYKTVFGITVSKMIQFFIVFQPGTASNNYRFSFTKICYCRYGLKLIGNFQNPVETGIATY